MRFIIDDGTNAPEKEIEVRLHPETKRKIRNVAIYLGCIGACLGYVHHVNRPEKDASTPEK